MASTGLNSEPVRDGGRTKSTGIRRKPVGSGQQYLYEQAVDVYHEGGGEPLEMTKISGAKYSGDVTEERTSFLKPLTDPSFDASTPITVPPMKSNDATILMVVDPSGSVKIHRKTLLSRWASPSDPRMWDPIWLRKAFLLCFSLVFLLVMLTIALLYHFSLVNNGLRKQEEAHHYGWKYGPTAVLIIVATLWRQVDYTTKTLMPWQEMNHGPVSAEKSVLLDYISPLVTSSFWSAIKNRHWVVVITTSGWLFLVLTTIFSTGLMVLEPTIVSRNGVQIAVKSQFNAEGFSLLDVSSTPADLFYSNQFQGLQLPPGTFMDRLVPELDSPSGANFSAVTPGLEIDFDCQILPIKNATKTFLPWHSINGAFWVTNITTPDCNITGAIIAAGADHNIYHQNNGTQNYQGRYQDFTCNFDIDYSSDYQDMPFDTLHNRSRDHQVLLSVSDLRFSPYASRTGESEYIYLNNLTIALCKASYSMHQYTASGSSYPGSNGDAVKINGSDTQPNDLSEFPSSLLGLTVFATTNQITLGQGGVDYVLSTQVPSFFQLLSLMNGNSSIGAFMDSNLLIQYSSKIFKGIGVQLLRQHATKPGNGTLPGSITYMEDRLHVKALSTGLMCGLLAALTIISLATVLLRPTNVVPRDPSSIAATATVLSSSPSFERCLAGLGAKKELDIRKRLSEISFHVQATLHPALSFSVETNELIEERDDFQESEDSGPEDGFSTFSDWYPVAGHLWFFFLCIAIPLIVVVLLEVVQHFSDDNSGFINVGPTSTTVLATYIPAIITVIIAAMYSSFGSMVAIFAPFAALKTGHASADRAIFIDFEERLVPHAMFLSLTKRHFGLSVILLANLIGGFLTIVVSGLYSVTTIPVNEIHFIHQEDGFDFDNSDLSIIDNQATALTRVTQSSSIGLPYPKWTYGDMVFNTLQNPNITWDSATTPSIPLSVTIPATRAALNCSVVPSTSRLLSVAVDDSYGDGSASLSILPGQTVNYTPIDQKFYVLVNTTLPWQSQCDRLQQSNVTESEWLQYYYLPNNSAPAYIGSASIMSWYSDLIAGDGAVDTDISTGHGNAVTGLYPTGFGCPSISVTLGTARLVPHYAQKHGSKKSNTTTYSFDSDLATILCYQNLEQVMATVILDLPSLNINKFPPPTPIENTSHQLYRNGKYNASSQKFEFSLNAFLLSLTTFLNTTIAAPENGDPYYNDIDGFIDALVTFKDGVPIEQISGERNAQNLMEASSKLYKSYIAQAISQNMRTTTAPPESLPIYSAQVFLPGTTRLKQNSGPKIALQVMLAVMVACLIISRFLVKVKGVLPHNPCSIAGTATLLAGSRMCDRDIIPAGSEWMGDKELKQQGVFSGELFRLDWWGEGEKRRFGVDVQEGHERSQTASNVVDLANL